MSEGLEKLHQLGTKKIHERTHISRANLEEIISKRYRGMTKIQLFGFLSILEREFKIDLSDIRADYRSKHTSPDSEEAYDSPSDDLPTAVKKQKKPYLIAAIVILIVLIAWIGNGDGEDTDQKPSPAVISETEPQEPAEAVTAEVNQTTVSEPVLPEAPAAPQTLLIEPKSKLWMGFIELDTLKRSQKLTTDIVELNASKGWLMVFGHGFFKVRIDDNLSDFSSQRKMRMIYEDGELREIDSQEFKSRNRGDNW